MTTLTKEQRDLAQQLATMITEAQMDYDPDIEELRYCLNRCVSRFDDANPPERAP